jgi:hypothetical protein
MVIVHKENGDIRLCLDPSDLNKVIKRRHHPMKTVEEVVSQMPGAKVFSMLDAKQGFWQIRLDEVSSKLCTFNTPFGRYRFLRLPFGVADAPANFQQVMTEIFGDISDVIVDDLLIWGTDTKDHDRKLIEILNRCRKVGIKLNSKKLRVGVDEVTYVGHVLSEKGISADPKKVAAIVGLEKPVDRAGVMRFIGMATYVSKFIKNFSDLTSPLRDLIKKDVVFEWNSAAEGAFNKLKAELSSKQLLGYFDPTKPIELHVDASSVGIGCVLIQDRRPVSYASCALTKTQQNYAQIEKECLAVYVGCTKFHQYVYGQKVTVFTDHKPLEVIFKRDLTKTPARIYRILFQLKAYDLDVKWVPGKELFIPDTLSRAYLKEEMDENTIKDLEIHVHAFSTSLPISNNKTDLLLQETATDDTMQELHML